MGCTGSKQIHVANDLQPNDFKNLKDIPSKTKDSTTKLGIPSATKVENSDGRTSPSRESSDACSAANSARQENPIAPADAWARKRPNTSDRVKDIDTGGNGFGRGGTAMFIPFENSSSRPPSAPTKSKRSKKSKSRYTVSCAPKAGKEQSFIPGSGTERMLFRSKPTTSPSVLPPLGFNKVTATPSLKEKIASDKKAKKEAKKMAKEVARLLRHEMGVKKDKHSSLINELVLGYADLLPTKQVDVVQVKKHSDTSSNDPWAKRKLL